MHPDAIRRALVFMLVAIACYAWALSAIALSSHGGVALLHLLGIGAPRTAPAIGWLLAALVTALFCAGGMRGYPLIRAHLFDWSLLKLVAIPFAMGSGIVEEFWFRRVPMDWALAHGAGAAAQVLLSALAFGAVHAVWGVAARNARVAAASMVATGLLGAGLALTYLAAGRVLAPCIWAHAAINLVLEPWLLVAAMTRGATARAASQPGGA